MFYICSCGIDSSSNTPQTEHLPYYNEASFTPIWLDPTSNRTSSLHRIPEFTLKNQEGDTITNSTFKNKIYVTDFFFTTCPGICPKMTKNMHLLQDKYIDDQEVLLISHSVTPNRDSVSVLRSYAEEHAILSNKWHLVTGDQKTIYELGRKGYFVEEDLGLQRDSDEFLHTENFVLVDYNQHIRGIYNGLNLASIRQLTSDIDLLKKEMKYQKF